MDQHRPRDSHRQNAATALAYELKAVERLGKREVHATVASALPGDAQVPQVFVRVFDPNGRNFERTLYRLT